MRPTLQMRKLIIELTEIDIDAYPIWEYALDEEGLKGQDETWIRPLDVPEVPRSGYSFQVAADLKTASGLDLVGIVDISTAGKVAVSSAVILSGRRYISVPQAWQARPWAPLADAFGLTDADCALLGYKLRVPIEGRKGLRSGVIE